MRSPARDDAGRPIVAELGRAETPQETADRKAAASARRRTNQNALNLVIALVASLGIVAFLVIVVVRPDGTAREPVDVPAAAAGADRVLGTAPLVPELPDGWSANRAVTGAAGADGVATWQVGYLTPGDEFIQLTQAIDANPSWLDDAVAGATSGAVVRIGGIAWTTYDRRDAADPGNVAYALVAERDDQTVVLSGTADDEEFRVLAEAVAAASTAQEAPQEETT